MRYTAAFMGVMRRIGDEDPPFRYGIGDADVVTTGRGQFAMYDEGFAESGDVIVQIQIVQKFDPGSLGPLPVDRLPSPAVAEEMVAGPVDAVALYRPYHEFREAWGIFVYERRFFELAASLAAHCSTSTGLLAPFVLRQVIAHEQVHFAWEVAGTEIEDILGEPAYRPYLIKRRDGQSPWTTGRLEEVLASHAEVRYARGAESRRRNVPAPAGYSKAVAGSLARVGARYADWEEASRRDEPIRAALATMIAGWPDRHMGRWGRLQAPEMRQAPVFWVGSPATLASLAGKPGRVMPPSRAAFEDWARTIMGAEIRHDRHMQMQKRVHVGRRAAAYAAAPDWLVADDADSMAQLFDAVDAAELFAASTERRRPRPPDQPLGSRYARRFPSGRALGTRSLPGPSRPRPVRRGRR